MPEIELCDFEVFNHFILITEYLQKCLYIFLTNPEILIKHAAYRVDF